MQVGGELGAHGGAHLLLAAAPQRDRLLEQRAAGRRGHQLVAPLVARLAAFDQPPCSSGRRLRVSVVRSVASRSDSRPIETGPSDDTKPSRENCEILSPVGARCRL